MRSRCLPCLLSMVMLVANSKVHAEQIVIEASRDNTLFSESNNSAGGAGAFFVGRTNEGNLRRGLLQFNVGGVLPASATVTSVSLGLHLERASSSDTQTSDIELHRVTSDWGEGLAGAGGGGGSGSIPTLDDATWLHAKFDSVLWTVAGGDFADTPSATARVGTEVAFYHWPSTAELVADVQGWLDDPGSNFGWALLGGESRDGTARRFHSREAAEAFRPTLAVEFTMVPEPSAMLLLVCSAIAVIRAMRSTSRHAW